MSLPSVIRTERLVLRPFEMGDLDGYLAYYTGPRTAGVGGPKPRRAVVERFHAMAGQWSLRGFGRYAVTTGGAAFGHVGPLQVEDGDPVEMTWTLWDGSKEGRGYATEAARAVLNAWREGPLAAFVHPSNAASLRLAAPLGFEEDSSLTPPPAIPEAATFRWTNNPAVPV